MGEGRRVWGVGQGGESLGGEGGSGEGSSGRLRSPDILDQKGLEGTRGLSCTFQMLRKERGFRRFCFISASLGIPVGSRSN